VRWHRVRGILRQNWYVMKRSPIRIFELFYWPVIEVVLWGFITSYLITAQAQIPGGVGVLLGAVLLWDLLFRSQQELSITQLIDIWDRNIVSLYASPLRQSEYLAGSLIFSVIRVMVGTSFLIFIARLWFGFNLLQVGGLLVPAMLALVMFGWALGVLIRAVIMRFGTNAEVLAWSLAFLLQPVSAVFYPVAVLPAWLQTVAQILPTAHVFESLRAYLATGQVLSNRLALAIVLSAGYLAASSMVALVSYRRVRQLGLLAKPGF
jgi:ABC-2 type transport system permease protein